MTIFLYKPTKRLPYSQKKRTYLRNLIFSEQHIALLILSFHFYVPELTSILAYVLNTHISVTLQSIIYIYSVAVFNYSVFYYFLRHYLIFMLFLFRRPT